MTRRRWPPGPTARLEAAAEAIAAYQAISADRKRSRILVHQPGREPVDVTEDVVSLMDAVMGTLDWGSGFLDDNELRAIIVLADLLKVDVPDVVRVKAQAVPRGELPA